MSVGKSQIEVLAEISEKLDIVIGFMAVRDINDVTEQIEKLSEMKMHPKAISVVVGISEGAIAVRLTRMKKKKKAAKTKK